MEQGPDFWCWFDTTQFSFHCVHRKDVFNPNVTAFQSNCANGLHFSAFHSVCVSVCFPYSGTSRNQAYKQQYQRLQRDTGMKYKMGFFFKTLRSEVMASFTHLEWLRRRFRDPSAVLSTKLGSTLLRKPIATVSLHKQRTSRRQRASHLHGIVNGDVYGSRILIVTPTSLSHVRAIYILGLYYIYIK